MFSEQNFLQGPRQSSSNSCFNMYNLVNQSMYNSNYNVAVQKNYMYPPSTSYNNFNEDASVITTEKQQNDEKSIESFLQEVEQSDDISKRKEKHKAFKIAMAKDILASAFKLNEKLKIICEELKNAEELMEEEWQQKVHACNIAKLEIIKLLEPIRDPHFRNQLKKDVERRKKKRLREKLKKEKWKNEKLLRGDRRSRLHAEIDLWIRKEQAVIEKEKQEESLRKGADMILSDVRGKRNDARKYLALLHELQNLRSIKANIARARGEHLSLAADEAFNNIIVKLTEQWTTLDREYSIEEQGLKLMLKSDNEKRIEKQKKSLFDDWENVLFGRKIWTTDQFHEDLNNFVAIRTAWDKYISSDKDASTIPIGWIVPDKPSSAAWQKCLRKQVL